MNQFVGRLHELTGKPLSEVIGEFHTSGYFGREPELAKLDPPSGLTLIALKVIENAASMMNSLQLIMNKIGGR
jgi:hypothetical protein